jgi:NAD(P)-dependent dehydrogenase (short-subunit alcohol dehydrogenase family)
LFGRGGHESLTVVVTGAAGGIGRAVASRFAQAGHAVLGVVHREHHREPVASALRSQAPEPERIAVVQADVTDRGSLSGVPTAVRALGERVDVLVPAAGVTVTGDSPRNRLVNTDGVLLTVDTLLEAGLLGPGGVVVTPTTTWAREDLPPDQQAPPVVHSYVASKRACDVDLRRRAADGDHPRYVPVELVGVEGDNFDRLMAVLMPADQVEGAKAGMRAAQLLISPAAAAERVYTAALNGEAPGRPAPEEHH